jgi:hypothetical protein
MPGLLTVMPASSLAESFSCTRHTLLVVQPPPDQRTDMSFELHSRHFIASDEPSYHLLDEHKPAAAFPVSV